MTHKPKDKIFKTYFNETGLKTVKLKKAKHLFNQGEQIDFIFYIKNGAFNIIKDKKMLWQAQENEFIGISSFFSEDEIYSYTVRASVDAEIIKIPVSIFKDKIEKSTELNAYLMKIFCDRIKMTLNKKENISYLTKKRKVVKLLLNKAKNKNKLTATLNYSVKELSKMINIPTQIIIDTLNDLQKKHLLDFNGNKIEILDFQALQLTL